MNNWYVLRVQSNKEAQVRDSLERRVLMEAMQDVILDVRVPSERVTEIRGGEKRVRERKTYPGYIFVEIETGEKAEIPESAWFLIRETPGIGDFLGAGRAPTPMSPRDVEKMEGEAVHADDTPMVDIGFVVGEAVRIKEGPFENFDGTVDTVSATKGLVRVVVTIFGRPTPVELEYWQVEKI